MYLKLVIGNQNYSSWSLRPWMLLTAFNVHFEPVRVSLKHEGLKDRLLEHSPSARVPVLIERELVLWDSLAICEYISEVHLDGQGWPSSPLQRAQARALTCEMHAGFNALRAALPMNIRAKRQVTLGADVLADIARIDQIWSAHHTSGWLFSDFGIVDCFFAPVALRFVSYNIELSDRARAYQQKLLGHPALKKWLEQAALDTEYLPEDEAGVDV